MTQNWKAPSSSKTGRRRSKILGHPKLLKYKLGLFPCSKTTRQLSQFFTSSSRLFAFLCIVWEFIKLWVENSSFLKKDEIAGEKRCKQLAESGYVFGAYAKDDSIREKDKRLLKTKKMYCGAVKLWMK